MDLSLIKKNDKVLIAFSGGPDSVCLTDILKKLQSKLKIQIALAHFNHKLRKKESDKDEVWVKAFAKKHKLRLFTKSEDVKKYAEKNKLSIEDAARRLRYKFLSETAQKHHFDKIAVAHNSDDRVETYLINLLRGSGPEGLTSMRSKNSNVVRPLLGISKKEINKYCRDNELKYLIDSTNKETIFLRNKIRHQLLPKLKEYNPEVDKSIFRMIDILEKESDYIACQVSKVSNNVLKKEKDKIKIELKKIRNIPEALQRRLVRLSIKQGKGDLINVSWEHILKITDEINNNSTERWQINLPGNTYVYHDNKFLIISKKSLLKETNKKFSRTFKLPGSLYIKEAGIKIKATVLKSTKNIKINESSKNVVFINSKSIKNPVIVRSWREGDEFKPFGFKGTKKLQDLFIDEKIPFENRKRIPVFESAGKIFWVGGIRTGEIGRIKNRKEKAYKIEIQNPL